MRAQPSKHHRRGRSDRIGQAVLLWLALVMLAGCDSSPDLPSEWRDATKLRDFTQLECGGSPIGGPAEAVSAEGAAGRIDLQYDNAHFRCAQDVEAFARRSGADVDILVQPVDMDPRSVARCDCAYDLVAAITAEAGEHTVTVYRRWDNRNSDNDPVKVGSVEVVVLAED